MLFLCLQFIYVYLYVRITAFQKRSFLALRDVAQPGSAPAWGVGGRRFKSSHPDQFSFFGAQMDSLIRLVEIVGPIFLIVLIGFLYARKRSPELSHANAINIELFTPFLIFSVLSQGDFQLEAYGTLALAAAFVVLLPGLLSLPVAGKLGLGWKVFVPPMMFRNSGNLGLPLLLFAFGEEALPAAVILFIVENTLHFSVGMKMLKPGNSLLALLRIPMLQATILGLLFAHFQWALPEFVQVAIKMLGQISIPLMLFALGARLYEANLSDWRVGLISGLWAPVCGLTSALLVSMFLDLPEQQLAMLLIFSALPPAVLNYLVAEQLNYEPERVASIVLTGNIMSALVLPLVLVFVL